MTFRLFRGTGRFGPRAAAPNRGPSGDVTAEARTSTRTFGTMHPAPGSHPSAKADGTCSALSGRPASAPPYVGRLHGVLADLPSTRIASVAHVELDQSFLDAPPRFFLLLGLLLCAL